MLGDGRRQLVLGYEPLQDQIIILDRASFCQHGYIYNLKTQSFSYGEYLAPNAHSSLANASSFEPIVTNFVNDSRGQLIISYDTGSLDIGSAGANTVHTTAYEPFNTGASTALTSANKTNKSRIFRISQITPGIKLNGYKSIGESHPPKNKIDPKAHISKMFAYSPNQNIAYIIPEYSVW